MTTSKSPRKVLVLAHQLAQEVLPAYGSHFSRKDFTRPQLFACLVLREHQRKSFRGTEALLADSPAWLAEIGLSKPPDHNTLCRAFDAFMRPALARSMLDLMAELAKQRTLMKRNRRRHKPLAIDSSMYESRHVSRHFDERRRRRRSAGLTPCKKGPVRGGNSSTAGGGGSSTPCRNSRWLATAPPT